MANSHRPVPITRRLQFEPLESRSLLAGNVSAAVTDGVLRILGDEAGNDVQIRQIPQTVSGDWPGVTYQIVGRSRNNSTLTTTINGKQSVFVEGVKNGVSIGLGHGDNFLRVYSDVGRQTAALPGEVTIHAGSGDDLLRLPMQNHSRVTINSGGGADRIELGHVTLYQLAVYADWPDAAALAHAGSDQIVLDGVVRGAASFYLGPSHLDAADSLLIGNSQFFAGLDVKGVVGSFYWFTAVGALSQIKGPVDVVASHVEMSDVGIVGSFSVAGNGLANECRLNAISVTQELTLRGLAGDDLFRLREVEAMKTVIDGGAGNDVYRDHGDNSLGDLRLLSIEKRETG